MNVLEKVFAAGRVLKAGESLQDPARWKNVQNSMNALTVILTVAAQFAGWQVDDSQINAVAYGIATALNVMFNIYFTTATTDKIGLPNKDKS
jgi:methenyltetrahydromethanopterin cyclohydrolase